MTDDQRTAYLAQWWGEYSAFTMSLYATLQTCAASHAAIVTTWDDFARVLATRP